MASQQPSFGQSFSRKEPTLNLLKLERGTKVTLSDGSTAEIVENPRDGYWVLVRFLASSDESRVGKEEMVLCYDLAGIAD